MGCTVSAPSRTRSQGRPELRADMNADGATAQEGASDISKPSPSGAANSPHSHEPADLQPTDSITGDAEEHEVVAQLGRAKLKDEPACKEEGRPRSALKHSTSVNRSEHCGDDELVERTPSGRKVYRRVSFQAKGLGAPVEAAEEGHSSTKFKGAKDMSMKKIVDGLYERVLDDNSLQPFFEGVDMEKLKNQQEALMLLVFGGRDLLESEIPGISADLRAMHLHLIHRGLGYTHWEVFAQCFYKQLDAMHPPIPPEVKAKAIEYMQSTREMFRPLEPGEWPPKNPYKGVAACPYASSFKHSNSNSASASRASSLLPPNTSTTATPHNEPAEDADTLGVDAAAGANGHVAADSQPREQQQDYKVETDAGGSSGGGLSALQQHAAAMAEAAVAALSAGVAPASAGGAASTPGPAGGL